LARYHYYWEVTLKGSTTVQTYPSDKEDFNNALPGSYTLFVEDQRGCKKQMSATVQGAVDALQGEVSTLAPLCAEQFDSLRFTLQGGEGPYKLKEVSNPQGASSAGTLTIAKSSNAVTTYDIKATQSGNYSYALEDAFGCSIVLYATVAPSIAFQGGIVSTLSSLRASDQSTLIARTVAGYKMHWNNFLHPSETIQIITTPGTYTVTYSKPGCSSLTKEITIIENTSPKVKSLICSATTPIDIPIDTVDHCEEYKRLAADVFARYRYELYVSEQKRNIRAAYMDEILSSAEESLTINFTDTEEHYTMYYYDQSGNLVRTIPPSGVKVLSPDQTDKAVDEILYGTSASGNILTEHDYTTTYAYNSLNQLVHQDIPDHMRMDLWDASESAVDLNGGAVAGVAYNPQGNGGLMISNTQNKAQLLSTTDAGKSWQNSQNIGLGKITTICSRR
jgi:hypothetical protein